MHLYVYIYIFVYAYMYVIWAGGDGPFRWLSVGDLYLSWRGKAGTRRADVTQTPWENWSDPWNCVRPQKFKSESDSIFQEISNRTHWTDPSIALATYLPVNEVPFNFWWIFSLQLLPEYPWSRYSMYVHWSNLIKLYFNYTALAPKIGSEQ